MKGQAKFQVGLATTTSKPLTEVGALPLPPQVAHEWSTLLTVMKQAHQLKELTVGEEYITVITYDMALYAKAVQLVDARPDLKGEVLPKLGELHVVMCALRALGSSIENSGIDDAWMEADVYGSATTRQIIKCTTTSAPCVPTSTHIWPSMSWRSISS